MLNRSEGGSSSSDEEQQPLSNTTSTSAASTPPKPKASKSKSSASSDTFLVYDISSTALTTSDVPQIHPAIIHTETTTPSAPPSFTTTTVPPAFVSSSSASTTASAGAVSHSLTPSATLPVPYVVSGIIPEDIIEELVHTPIAQIQCDIHRIKRGLLTKPSYELFVHGTNQFLLSGRKKKHSRSYVISTDRAENVKISKKYTGEVTSNFFGTEFVVYDYGTDPKLNTDTPRSELVSISYVPDPMGLNGPRKLCVLIPSLGHTAGVSTLLQQFKEGHTENITHFQNVPPVWDANLKQYTLHFHGRATRASVRNFQLTEVPIIEGAVKLLLGRTGDNLFSLDFNFPFTPCQAFGVAITAFDFKLAVE
ncbi:tubby protein [Pelomyxa schiedti]|nr:tubby protein [Pelomyxa schiedti]